MPSSKDFQGRKTPSILLVGDGGTEKTRFSVQAPDVFVFDIDAGLASTHDLPEFQYQTFKDAPYKSKAINEAMGFYPWGTAWTKFFEHLNDKVWPEIEKGTFPHKWIVVDSLTMLSVQCFGYIIKTAGHTGDSAPTLPEHGSFLALMENVLSQLAAWPVGLILTAHVKRDDNLVMGTKEYLPLVSGQLSARLGVYFDEVWYTEVQGTGASRKVVIKTAAEGTYKQAKSRNNIPTNTELKWSALGKYLGV